MNIVGRSCHSFELEQNRPLRRPVIRASPLKCKHDRNLERIRIHLTISSDISGANKDLNNLHADHCVYLYIVNSSVGPVRVSQRFHRRKKNIYIYRLFFLRAVFLPFLTVSLGSSSRMDTHVDYSNEFCQH